MKTITAIYGKTLFIDPLGQTPDTIKAVKERVESVLKKKFDVVVAPASQWMPSTAGEALAKQVAKDMGVKYIPFNRKKQ